MLDAFGLLRGSGIPQNRAHQHGHQGIACSAQAAGSSGSYWFVRPSSHWRQAPAVHGQHGMVASRSALASEVGADIMRAGGNAIDAAVATGFALAVTYPAAGNLGGGGFMVIRLDDGRVVTNDHRERAPGARTARHVSR